MDDPLSYCRATNMKSVHTLRDAMIADAQNMLQIPLPVLG